MAERIKQPTGLLSVLLDSTAEYGDRDDAAVDLGAYDNQEVEEGLTLSMLDPSSPEGVAESCAESLAEVWARKGRIDRAVIARAQGRPAMVLTRMLDALIPEWRKEET